MDAPAENNVHIRYDQTKKYYHEVVGKLASKWTPHGGSIIDVGCGVGHVAEVVAMLRPDIQIDIADAYSDCIDVTRKRATVRNAYLLDEKSLDLSAIGRNGYNTLILSHVLEHVPRPLDAINDLSSLLSLEGKMVLAVPNSLTPNKFILAAFKRYKANKGHCFHWDRGHWKNFLENIAGLKVYQYSNDEVYLFKRTTDLNSPFKLIEKMLGMLFPAWSFSHIAVVGKR